MPKVSVIIPCYNQGQYLDEAVTSVINQTFTNYEIIVVDDGSTDQQSLQVLGCYKKDKTTIYRTDNAGPAAARNYGIVRATGDYILPLDADDKIESTYMEKSVAVLDSNPEIGIVYCKAKVFGRKNGQCRWAGQPFDLHKMLIQNLIFCSAFFRRSDWGKVKGYNTNMKSGLEDWDFWLSLLDLNRQVYQIPEYLFYYRIKEKSRSCSLMHEDYVRLHAQVFLNHKELFCKNIDVIFEGYYRLLKEYDSLPYKITRGFINSLKVLGRFFRR